MGDPWLWTVFSSEQSQFKLIGNYKEGHVDWQGKVNWKPLTTELSLNQDQIPLGPLWQILTRRHVIRNDIQPKYLWLTCALKYSGKILDLETHPLALEPCTLDGDIGNIAVDRGQLYPWRKPPFDPFKLKLKDLDLQKLLAMFQRSGLSGILSRYGLIDGELQVETPEQMKFTGKIRQLEMAFSNRGVRGKQAVPELKGELLLNGDRVSGNLFEMDLAGGEFKGQMTFNMDRQFRNGAIQLAIDRLRFNHSIQNLMVGGEIDQISAFGHGQIEDGELSNWKGDFGVLSLRGADWGLEKAKLSTELSQNVFFSIVSIKKVSLMAGEGFFRLLKPLLLEEENLENEATLVNLTGRLRLSKKSGKWEKVKAFSAAKTQLTSEGSWDETRSIKGLVKVISPPSRPLTWEIGGDLDHMQLSPTAQTLKEFKQTHPELKAPETVDFIRAGELLVHEISVQGVEKIKSFGEKVIETARKIIPEESPSPPAPVGEANSK